MGGVPDIGGAARITRSHGLGNDYLVADPADLPFELTPARVRRLCHRHLGVGSDGVLLLSPTGPDADFGLRILNPDGSEAEKSGNGIRIFAYWLRQTGRATADTFSIATPGGLVAVEVSRPPGEPASVLADMGVARIRADLRQVDVAGETLPVVAVSIGNPHCVVVRERLEVDDLRRLGPLLERHAAFPNRTNVQLARPRSRSLVDALVWERGAGETLASGSSACAVAVACHYLGLVESAVTVAMPGGELAIRVEPDGHVWMRGPVEEVGTIWLSDEFVARLQALG